MKVIENIHELLEKEEKDMPDKEVEKETEGKKLNPLRKFGSYSDDRVKRMLGR